MSSGQGGGDRETAAGVIEICRRELAGERRPPAADGMRPQEPATEGGDDADHPPTGAGRQPGRGSFTAGRDGVSSRRGARSDPETGGRIPPDLIARTDLALGQTGCGDRRDLHRVSDPLERSRDPEGTGIRRDRVPHEHDGSPADHHARPVSRPYSSRIDPT